LEREKAINCATLQEELERLRAEKRGRMKL